MRPGPGRGVHKGTGEHGRLDVSTEQAFRSNCDPSKTHVAVLTPSTSDGDLIWTQDLYIITWKEVIGMGPNPV